MNSVWNIPVLTLIIFSHTESTESTDFPLWRYFSDVRRLHFESTEWHLFHCACLANRICTLKKLYIPLCTVLGGKSSYRQGSFLAWNQPWTWMSRRMTICQHRQDKTTAMMDVPNILLLLRFLFYNPPIINSMRYAYFCRHFYRNSAVTCARTSLFLTIYFNKNLYTARKGFYSSTVLQSEIMDCYRRYNIYINIY